MEEEARRSIKSKESKEYAGYFYLYSMAWSVRCMMEEKNCQAGREALKYYSHVSTHNPKSARVTFELHESLEGLFNLQPYA